MSAVVNEPRANSAAAAAPQAGPWVRHIDDVRSMVRKSMSLTCSALEKADYGKPAYTLLTCASAEYSTILRHLDLGPVSEADVQFLSDEGIWPALGMLAGALSLVEHDEQEAALGPVIREAHATLDAAHSQLDSTIVHQIGAPQVNVARRDFCLGRDLAIELLSAGDAMDNTDKAEAYRWMRGGAAQERFALPFLRRLLAEPELIEGFAAVLSARLGTGDHTAPDYYDLPMAEYEAGEVGADGTEVDSSPVSAPAAQTDPVDDKQSDRMRIAATANYQIEKLAEALKALLMRDATEEWPIFHGILGRIQQLTEVVYYAAGFGGTDEDVGYPGDRMLQLFLDGHLGQILGKDR